jgi:hypothetical protein
MVICGVSFSPSASGFWRRPHDDSVAAGTSLGGLACDSELNYSSALSFPTYFSLRLTLLKLFMVTRGVVQKVISDWIVSNQLEYQIQRHIFKTTALPTCVLALAQPIGFWTNPH